MFQYLYIGNVFNTKSSGEKMLFHVKVKTCHKSHFGRIDMVWFCLMFIAATSSSSSSSFFFLTKATTLTDRVRWSEKTTPTQGILCLTP